MEKSKNTKLIIHVAIYAAIIAVFWLMPPFGAMTPAGMRFFGLFVAFVFALTVTGEAWPGLATLVIMPFTGIVDFAGVVGTGLGGDVPFFIVLSLVLVAYVDKSGAASFVATWLLQRKALKGHPWRLLTMVFFIGWLISSFVNAIAGMMLLWAFLYGIFDQFGYKPFDKLPSLIMFGTCVVGGLGLSTLPWGNNSIVILAAFTQQTGMEVNYLEYMAFSIPYAFITILMFVLMMKFVFRADVSALKNFDPSQVSAENQEFTKGKLVALLSMLALIILILVPSILPADSPIVAVSKLLGLSGKLLLIFAVVYFIRIDGEPACDFPKVAKGINWTMVLIIMTIMVFTTYIGSKDVGLNQTLNSLVAPIIAGQSPLFFSLLTIIVTVILTNFMVNKIVGVLMVTITIPIVTSLGLDPIQFACIYTVACTIAFLLPAASQSACVLFSNTEWVRAADVLKFGLPTIIAMTLLMLVWSTLFFAVF